MTQTNEVINTEFCNETVSNMNQLNKVNIGPDTDPISWILTVLTECSGVVWVSDAFCP